MRNSLYEQRAACASHRLKELPFMRVVGVEPAPLAEYKRSCAAAPPKFRFERCDPRNAGAGLPHDSQHSHTNLLKPDRFQVSIECLFRHPIAAKRFFMYSINVNNYGTQLAAQTFSPCFHQTIEDPATHNCFIALKVASYYKSTTRGTHVWGDL